MIQITEANFYLGRDTEYAKELTDEVKANAAITIERANKLLELYQQKGGTVHINPNTKCCVDSGWRPPAVNAGIANAAPHSKHMIGAAVDIYDPDGDLDDFCLRNLGALQQFQLWMEHPASTKGWCHVQIIPPGSNNRVFYP